MLSSIRLTFLCLLISNICHAQFTKDRKSDSQNVLISKYRPLIPNSTKARHFHRMQNAGVQLMISGGILIVGSIVVRSAKGPANTGGALWKALTETNNEILDDVSNGLAIGGSVCLGIGSPLLIFGVVNKEKFRDKDEEAILFLNAGPDGLGFALRF